MGKRDTLHARRHVLSTLPRKDVVRRLFSEVSPRFADRPGGYTRILKLGPRKGDGAQMAFIELVDYEFKGSTKEIAEDSSKQSKKSNDNAESVKTVDKPEKEETEESDLKG